MVHVDLCRTVACAPTIVSFDSAGTSMKIGAALTSGIYFWRLSYVGQTAVSPTWSFLVGKRTSSVDSSWPAQLDVNRDGLADAVVQNLGMNPATGGIIPQPQAYYGTSAGLPTVPSAILAGPEYMMTAGAISRVASLGDINGDGFSDVGVTGGGSNFVYVFFGGPGGLPSTPSQTLVFPNGETLMGMIPLGDTNRDGYADALVGSPMMGKTYYFQGGPKGFPPNPTSTLYNAGMSGVLGPGGLLGDVNGDGYTDAFLSLCAAATSPCARTIEILHGGVSGLPAASSPNAQIVTPSSLSTLVAGGGDLNGDGYADLAIASLSKGQVGVYFGGSNGLPSMTGTPNSDGWDPAPAALYTAAGASVAAGFATSIATAGDVNGDGYDDALVGIGTSTALYYFGGASLTDAPSGMLQAGTRLWSAAAHGDYNGDGISDLLLSDLTNATGPAVFVFPGTPTGPASAPLMTLPAPSSGMSFGGSLAMRLR
jgi:hypothetical protein